ncbi:protein AATF [Orussus abietinus]|uniref:protein AATF n=1 Tax=Orussus abietinus TaxID=222816 RepID=UPI000625AA06|nr:protein AATF [Orussus abietinus]
MSLKKKVTSLAEKISYLVTAAPTNFDSDDEIEDTRAKVVEHFDESDAVDDFQDSSFRKQNVELLDQVDERYRGTKISRKDVYEEKSGSSLNDDSIEEDSDSNLQAFQGSDSAGDDNDESDAKTSDEDASDVSGEEENSDEVTDSEVDEDNPLRRGITQQDIIGTIPVSNIRDDVEKGNCVRDQLKLWENFLEIRIKLQKCLVTSNKMPQYDAYKNFKSDNNFAKAAGESKQKLIDVLENMLKLQSTLLKKYPETKDMQKMGKKRKQDENQGNDLNKEDSMDEEIPSDTDEDMEEDKSVENGKEASEEEENEILPRKRLKLNDFENILAENHKAYSSYRNSVIQKWNDKTRVATGKLNKSSNQSVVSQIDFVLSDKLKVLKKTRLKRSEYEIVGKSSTTPEDTDGRAVQEFDSEIYDDDDFYHQLLRELIEYKSSDVTDPIQLSKQWILLQNMRSKMKRKIDTRATKGRRIRFNVHTKLVNFMAPITVNDTWTDLAKNELYKSLFGKIKAAEGETGQ